MRLSCSLAETTADGSREAEIRRWITGMPFVNTLGVTVEGARDGGAILRLELRSETSIAEGAGFPAATIGALIDLSAGAAVASLLPAGHVVSTLDFTIKMLAPLPGPIATATATAFRVSGGSAAARVEVTGGPLAEGEPRAVGLVSLRPIGPDGGAAR